MSTEQLFQGQADIFGGLSNELELSRLCPHEFLEDNPWSTYVNKLFTQTGNRANWKWKSDDINTQGEQLSCFDGLLNSSLLKPSKKIAIAGWMLSEMLMEVPEFVPIE